MLGHPSPPPPPTRRAPPSDQQTVACPPVHATPQDRGGPRQMERTTAPQRARSEARRDAPRPPVSGSVTAERAGGVAATATGGAHASPTGSCMVSTPAATGRGRVAAPRATTAAARGGPGGAPPPGRHRARCGRRCPCRGAAPPARRSRPRGWTSRKSADVPGRRAARTSSTNAPSSPSAVWLPMSAPPAAPFAPRRRPDGGPGAGNKTNSTAPRIPPPAAPSLPRRRVPPRTRTAPRSSFVTTAASSSSRCPSQLAQRLTQPARLVRVVERQHHHARHRALLAFGLVSDPMGVPIGVPPPASRKRRPPEPPGAVLPAPAPPPSGSPAAPARRRCAWLLPRSGGAHHSTPGWRAGLPPAAPRDGVAGGAPGHRGRVAGRRPQSRSPRDAAPLRGGGRTGWRAWVRPSDSCQVAATGCQVICLRPRQHTLRCRVRRDPRPRPTSERSAHRDPAGLDPPAAPAAPAAPP